MSNFYAVFFFNITLSQGNIFWSSYNLKWFFDVWFGCFLSAVLNVIQLVSDKLSNERMEISGLRQVDQLLWGEKSNSWVKQAKRVTFNVPIQYCYQLKYQIYKNHAAEHFSYLKKHFYLVSPTIFTNEKSFRKIPPRKKQLLRSNEFYQDPFTWKI